MERSLPNINSSSTIFAFEANKIVLVHTAKAVDETKGLPLTLADFIIAQTTDEFCKTAARQQGHTGIAFIITKESKIVRHEPKHGALQRLMRGLLYQQILLSPTIGLLLGILDCDACSAPCAVTTTD